MPGKPGRPRKERPEGEEDSDKIWGVRGVSDMTRQAVSKHLRILTECQIVKQEQAGREIYYHLQPKKMKVVADFIEPYRQMWETKFDQLDKVLTKLKSKK